MIENKNFAGHKRYREAKFIEPENTIKKKVGAGGINPELLHKAQEALDNNKVDFKPIALPLLKRLQDATTAIREGKSSGEEAMEELIQPAMQLKAQGGMFHFPLVSEIGNILINFLETVPQADTEVLKIIDAHHASITAILNMNIKDSGGTTGKKLCSELLDVCGRYYKLRGET